MSEVLVLYQISNDLPRGGGGGGGADAPPSYNAYYMPRKDGVTLATVKRSCLALQRINPAGASGYHWRVRIDEKPNTSHDSHGGGGGGAGSGSGAGSGPGFSWWDVQDENARLPVKEATPSELKRMLRPKKPSADGDVTQEVTKAAKGAMKYMGKAMNAMATAVEAEGRDDDFNAVRTPVICFKLLDLGKVRRERGGGGGGGRGGVSAGGRGRARPVAAAPRPARSRAGSSSSAGQAPRAAAPQARQAPRASAPVSAGAPRIPPHMLRQQQQQRQQPQRQQQQQQRPPAARNAPPTADLMGFGSAQSQRSLRHANTMPAASTPTGARPGETRAEKLKREYAKKQSNSNRVWDEVDQRWVDGPVKNGEVASKPPSAGGRSAGGAAANGGVQGAAAGVKGISLSRDNAAGKSADVQAAVHSRINDMEQNQQKAVGELRQREAAKAQADAEEDLVRQRLESRLKAWSEEHGKKKQLRALLANLHTILWEGSGWKQVSLADVLDDSKVKRVYHKASRVVHPDKTGHLDAEKRFIAKRVFDALTQAKVEFDEGTR